MPPPLGRRISGSISGGPAWPPDLRLYFGRARLADGRINPYWPLGFLLTGVSCLTEDYGMSTDLDAIRNYLATLDQVSPAERSLETALWLQALPEQKRRLRAAGGYGAVFSVYAEVVAGEIEVNGDHFRRRVGEAMERLERFLPTLGRSMPTLGRSLPTLDRSLPELERHLPANGHSPVSMVLNPLQADPLVDVVRHGKVVLVIASRLRPIAYVHELAHLYVDALVKEWTPLLSARIGLLEAVYEPMHRYSYAWDRSATSWINVFAETMVRCLTVLSMYGDNRELCNGEIAALEGEGFLYARPVYETIVSAGQSLLTEEWLADCLKACEVVAASAGRS